MQQIKELMQQKESFIVSFSNKSECEEFLSKVKLLGFKWVNGQQISLEKPLEFYFYLFVNVEDLTIFHLSSLCFKKIRYNYKVVSYPI